MSPGPSHPPVRAWGLDTSSLTQTTPPRPYTQVGHPPPKMFRCLAVSLWVYMGCRWSVQPMACVECPVVSMVRLHRHPSGLRGLAAIISDTLDDRHLHPPDDDEECSEVQEVQGDHVSLSAWTRLAVDIGCRAGSQVHRTFFCASSASFDTGSQCPLLFIPAYGLGVAVVIETAASFYFKLAVIFKGTCQGVVPGA